MKALLLDGHPRVSEVYPIPELRDGEAFEFAAKKGILKVIIDTKEG